MYFFRRDLQKVFLIQLRKCNYLLGWKVKLGKIRQNMGFFWPMFSRISAFPCFPISWDSVLTRKNKGQRNPVFWDILQCKKAKWKTLPTGEGDRKAVGIILVTNTVLSDALKYRITDVLLIAKYSKFRSYIRKIVKNKFSEISYWMIVWP